MLDKKSKTNCEFTLFLDGSKTPQDVSLVRSSREFYVKVELNECERKIKGGIGIPSYLLLGKYAQPTILKNRVIYTNNDEKSIFEVRRESPQSIATYGLLTDIEKVDTKKTNNLTQLAQNKLDELNRVKDSISLSMLGDYNVKKGVVIPLDITEYQLKGKYLILSVSHDISCTDEYVNILVEKTDVF